MLQVPRDLKHPLPLISEPSMTLDNTQLIKITVKSDVSRLPGAWIEAPHPIRGKFHSSLLSSVT